jgi:flagellar basal body-associated protein FliL
MRKILLIVLIVVVLLLVVGYAGMGYVIYSQLADVKGSCDEHLANRPDRFDLHPPDEFERRMMGFFGETLSR